MTINWQKIISYLLISSFINLSYLVLVFCAYRIFVKQSIEEIFVGFDNLYVFYINKIKIILGLTFFLATGIKPIYSEDPDINKKQVIVKNLLVFIVYSVLLIIALLFSGLNLKCLLSYLSYFTFIIDYVQLKSLLVSFSGIKLAVGIIFLGLAFSVFSNLTTGILSKNYNKYVTILHLVILVIWVFLYCRLIGNYILN